MNDLDRYHLLLIDIDGVVWRGNKPIRENVTAINSLHEQGFDIVFLTNNATKSRRMYVDKLSAILNYMPIMEDVVTTSYAISIWLKRNFGFKHVYPIGERGLLEELISAGQSIVNGSEANLRLVDFVIVSLDRSLTYRKLMYAHKAITLFGASFVATNSDNVLPVEEGTVPGTGSIISSLISSTGREPIFIAGKPNPWMAELVLSRFHYSNEEVLVIGDRCDTDVAFAKNAKLDSLLVLTGVTKEPSPSCKPTYLSKNLLDFTNP